MRKFHTYSAQFKIIQKPVNIEGASRENENQFQNKVNSIPKKNFPNKTKNLNITCPLAELNKLF